ncbi:hypothetical protein M9458_053334, partial [Cirrhinus mrigala]
AWITRVTEVIPKLPTCPVMATEAIVNHSLLSVTVPPDPPSAPPLALSWWSSAPLCGSMVPSALLWLSSGPSWGSPVPPAVLVYCSACSALMVFGSAPAYDYTGPALVTSSSSSIFAHRFAIFSPTSRPWAWPTNTSPCSASVVPPSWSPATV